MSALRLFLLSPATVFAAQVNQAAFAYPIGEVAYDGVTVGAYTDIQPGMTVLFGSTAGADDLGRQRIRKAPTDSVLYIGRSSRGVRDGEVDLADNAYITVLNDYRVWAKIPYIDDDGDMWKDHDLAVGTNTTTPPPVANAGIGIAGTVDSVTGLLRVTLPHEANASFATAAGATIASYAWTLPDGVALVDGYALSDSQIEVDCDPGFYWIGLTVTDSNGKTHTAWLPIYARDPDDDQCIAFQVEAWRVTREGQQVSLRILEAIPEGTYPDGTLAMVWEGEPADGADRSHMRFIGWHHSDPAEVAVERTGILKDTVIECLDVAGKLQHLPGFSQSVEGRASPAKWTEMLAPNMDLYLHYLLHWHSTALDVADFTWSGTTTNYPFVVLGSEAETLWGQLQRRAQALVPDYWLTCNRRGQLRVIVDPMLQDVASRTATVQATLSEADWSALRFTHQRPGRLHWLRGNAIKAHATKIEAIFCEAPGHSPGQGEQAEEHGEQLAVSQTALNACEGHRYARLNAPESPFSITLAGGDKGIEPADMTWVQLTMSAATAARRGLAFTEERGLPVELNIRYEHEREGMVEAVELIWERETSGTPAVTVIPPPPYEPPEFELPDLPPLPPVPGPEVPQGPMKAYILWDDRRVLRTWDITVSSPVWELINSGISGSILECHYIYINASMIGAWLLTSDGLYYTGDIMATPVNWTCKLSVATMRANQATPPQGTCVFRSIHPSPTDPAFLVLVTGLSSDAVPFYGHAYYWHTHDAGDNWTIVDDTAHTYRGMCYIQTSTNGIKMFQGTPDVIYAARATETYLLDGALAVFKSTDGGHSWNMGYWIHSFDELGAGGGRLTAPFPARTDPAYLLTSSWYADAGADDLHRTTNEWATGAKLNAAAGHKGMSLAQLPNSRTYEPNHIIGWWKPFSGLGFDLLDSDDAGVTWNLLLAAPDAGNDRYCYYASPTGWPPEPNTWVLIRATNAVGKTVVQYTADHFVSLQNKDGNLLELGTWVGSFYAGGHALPRVGLNA